MDVWKRSLKEEESRVALGCGEDGRQDGLLSKVVESRELI